MHNHLLAFDGYIRDPVMLKSREHGDVAGVEKVAVVGEDVAGCSKRPYLLAGEQAEGLGGEGGGAAESDFEEAREEGLGFGLSSWGAVSWVEGEEVYKVKGGEKGTGLIASFSSPSDFKRWGCHGRELSGNGEDAVELSIGEGSGYGGGDASKDSAYFPVRSCLNGSAGVVGIPRLPQFDVRNTIFIAKRELDIAESVECAPIQPNVFTQGFKNECPFVVRGLCLSRHGSTVVNGEPQRMTDVQTAARFSKPKIAQCEAHGPLYAAGPRSRCHWARKTSIIFQLHHSSTGP